MAAEAIGGPAPVAAADSDPIRIGESNASSSGSTQTSLVTRSPRGLEVRSGTDFTVAVDGPYGILGTSAQASGLGVLGQNEVYATEGWLGGPDTGVRGFSPLMAGVAGETSNPNGMGVIGINTPQKVTGMLASGPIAVFGGAPLDTSHHGLQVAGRVAFIDRSGTLTVAAGASSVSTAAPALTATTTVLATLQTNRPGVWIQAAVASRATGRIPVYLNKKVTAATKVAYLILN
jgi:hypothetical protein